MEILIEYLYSMNVHADVTIEELAEDLLNIFIMAIESPDDLKQ